MKYILLFLFTFTSIFSQSVIITDVKTNDYPDIDVNFLVVDESGNAINSDKDEITLTENGLDKAFTFFECEQDYSLEPMSIVITLDNSLSMNDKFNSKTISEITRESAKEILSLIHPDSEIAINYYNSQPFILLDFTNNRLEIIDAIDSMEDPALATDMNKAFLDSDYGVLKLFENAQYNKKINLFMTDAPPSEKIDKNLVINSFNNQGITLYSISAKENLNDDLIEITNRTNGKYYNAAQTEKQLSNAFKSILNFVNGAKPCTLTYNSDICDLVRDISVSYNATDPDVKQVIINKKLLVEYSIINNNQLISSNESNLYYTSIISKKNGLTVTGINSKFDEFVLVSPPVSEFPITLNLNESLNLVFSNKKINENIYDFFEIESNSCYDDNIYLKHYNGENALEVITPNGGEEYYINKSTDLVWEDTYGNGDYKVEYSTDAGSNWNTIVDNYNDLDFPWLSVEGPETNKALLKVSKVVEPKSRIQTVAVEEIIDPSNSGFEYIIPYQVDKYAAIINMTLDFKFSNVDVPAYSLDDIPNEDQGKNLKLLTILDSELNVLEYKPILTYTDNLSISSIGDNIYLELDGFYNLKFDTLNLSTTDFSVNNGIIIKFNNDLDYINHKLFQYDNQFSNQSDYVIDFKSSNKRLHLLGKIGRFFNYDNNNIIDEFFNQGIYYIISLNEDLDIVDNNFYDIVSDNFDFHPIGLIPKDDNSIMIWGQGEGTVFGLNSNFKGISTEYTVDSKEFSVVSYLEKQNLGNLEVLDYEYYKGFEYWLLTSDSTVLINEKDLIFGNDLYNISLVSLDDKGSLNWNIGFDRFGVNKNLNLFNNESIVVAGRMNSNVEINGTTISERGNTLFISALDIYTGNLNWNKYVGVTNYDGLTASNGNNFIISGKLNDTTDFGDGVIIDEYLNNFFLWSLNSRIINSFDISDSLWSIVSPGFEYIDTVDFGNVYSGSIKDTIVVDFFEITDKDADIIIEDINIEDAGYSVDIITPFKLEEDTDLKIILNVDIAGNGLAKGVITTNVGKFNFYVNSNEVELRYRPFYHNDSLVIDFGEVLIGNSKNEVHNVLANLGNANIGIDSIVIENNEGGNYSYNILSDNDYVLSNDTLITDFIFSPNFTGTHDSRYLFYTDINRIPFVINVTGIGISNDTVDVHIEIDSSYSDADKYIDVLTKIKFNDNPTSLQLEKIEVDIEYNATLLIPFRFEDDGIVENKIRKLTIDVDKEDITSKLSSNRFYTTIGNSISTDINITDVRAYNVLGDKLNEFKYEASDGYFELTNICYTDGNYRLYSDSNPTGLNLYSENGEYFVNYNLIEDGFTKISLYDTDGNLKSHLVDGMMNKGAYNAEINTENIASGSYIVQLETENIIISKMLIIVK